MRLRQVALVARDLDSVVADLCAVLGVEVAYRDPGVGEFGLRNAVMAIGDTFLEVVSPAVEGTAAGRYLDRRGGDGGYMVILQCDALETDRRRIAELGIRVVWQVDLPDMRGTHLHPADVGGAILSLDWANPPSSWRWAGPAWESTVRRDRVTAITAVEIQAADPIALAERWGDVLARPVEERGRLDRPVITLDSGEIRFSPLTGSQGEGISRVEFAAVDAPAILDGAVALGLPSGPSWVRAAGVDLELATPDDGRPATRGP
jgi:hypothetical protein